MSVSAESVPMPHEPVSDAAQRQRVLMQAKASRSLPLVDGILYSALGILLVPQVGLHVHIAWCLCILLIDSARSWLGFHVGHHINTINVHKVTLTMAGLDLLAGLSFGLGGAYMMLRSSEISMLFILGVAYIVPASGLLVLRASRLSNMLLAAAALLPVLWVWVSRHPEHAIIMSCLTLAFLVMVFIAAGHLAQVVQQTMNVSRERDHLIGSLEQRHLEAKDAMARAQEAARMRTQVLSSASHDLRQPMHALSIYAAVLKSAHTQDQLTSIVGKVDEVIHSLSDLLHRLLDLSRLISNQVCLKTEFVALDDLVRTTCSRHAAAAAARGIAFHMELAPTDVQGDASALEQVIDNLVENALKFTETGSITVKLSAAPDTESARLSVEDTGIGMSEADLGHVFEEYFQVRNQARNRRQGVGLGLAIVQRLCKLMDARISVCSESGRGSRFTLDFPLIMASGESDTGELPGTRKALSSTVSSADSPIAQEPGVHDEVPAGPVRVERAFKLDLTQEFVQARATALARGPWAQIVGLAGLVAFCLPYVPAGFLMAWASLFVLLAFAESVHGKHVLRHIQETDRLPSFDRMQCLLTFVLGIILAAGWAWVARSLPLQEYFLTGTTVLMFPLVCVTWVLGSRFSQLAFAVPVTLIVATSAFQNVEGHAMVLAAALAAYVMTIYVAGTEIESTMAHAVDLRRARERLARDLSVSNQAIRDATELTARESRMRTLALASASHDLRQPLHALAMCNATLSMRLSPETLLKVIRNLNNIVRSLGSLLHRLLDLSRGDTEGLLIESADIDLQAILHEICEQTRPTFEGKGLQFHADLSSFSVHADPVAVRRIVGNLLSNAGKFTDSGSVTLISGIIEEGGQQIGMIEVQDTGRGIPEAFRARIFDEYFQIGATSLIPEHGVGLGLAIVKRLCRMMNGEVAYSPLPAGGSSFRVTLPLGFATEADAEPQDLRTSPPASGVRVLMIEDDESIADSTLMLLQIWGYECVLASDGPQADACIASFGRPDLIIADLRLPGPEQGADIAQRLSAGDPPCAVLFITGETSGKAIEDALARGHTVLQKPVEPEALRIHIQKALTTAACR